jgi:hypothetical protein
MALYRIAHNFVSSAKIIQALEALEQTTYDKDKLIDVVVFSLEVPESFFLYMGMNIKTTEVQGYYIDSGFYERFKKLSDIVKDINDSIDIKRVFLDLQECFIPAGKTPKGELQYITYTYKAPKYNTDPIIKLHTFPKNDSEHLKVGIKEEPIVDYIQRVKSENQIKKYMDLFSSNISIDLNDLNKDVSFSTDYFEKSNYLPELKKFFHVSKFINMQDSKFVIFQQPSLLKTNDCFSAYRNFNTIFELLPSNYFKEFVKEWNIQKLTLNEDLGKQLDMISYYLNEIDKAYDFNPQKKGIEAVELYKNEVSGLMKFVDLSLITRLNLILIEDSFEFRNIYNPVTFKKLLSLSNF